MLPYSGKIFKTRTSPEIPENPENRENCPKVSLNKVICPENPKIFVKSETIQIIII